MSLFVECEYAECEETAEHRCHCGSEAQFLCKAHIEDHIASSHITEKITIPLSEQETSLLSSSVHHSIVSALEREVQDKNHLLSFYVKQIQLIEQQSALNLRTLKKNFFEQKKIIKEIVKNSAIPILSDAPIAKLLISLKEEDDFSRARLEHIIEPTKHSNDVNFFIEEMNLIIKRLIDLSELSGKIQFDPKATEIIEILRRKENPGEYVPFREYKTTEGHSKYILSVAVSSNSKVMASASADKTIKLWNTENFDLLHVLEGHTHCLTSLTFSESFLVSCSDDKTIKVWDFHSGKLIHSLTGHLSYVQSVSANDKVIVSASGDRSVKIWDIATGQNIHTINGHSNIVWCVDLAPSGLKIASGGRDNLVKLWKVQGEHLRTLIGHSGPINTVKFSPNSQILASAGNDRKIRIWNAETGKRIQEIAGHLDAIWSISFSPCQNFIASGSQDQVVKVWNVQTAEELQSLREHSDRIRSVCFSPCGNFLVSAGYDMVLRIWTKSNS